MSAKNKKLIDNQVENFYEHRDAKEFLNEAHNPNFDAHQLKIPFYMLICSASGTGKTNMVLNLIKRFDNTFHHIYYVCQEQEPLLEFLQKKIKKGLTIVYKISDLPTLEEFGKTKTQQKLLVFDDQLFVKSDYITTLFKRGRKLNISTIFISQSFYDTSKFIRKQIHYLILLSISGKRDIDSILRTYNMGDIEPEQLMYIFKDATKEPMAFLKIAVNERNLNKKFSKNFLDYYEVE
jgi:hypothetical protein